MSLTSKSIITTTIAAAALAAAFTTPAGAAGWSCDASALRGSVLGGAVVEPVVANADAGAAGCRTATRNLDGALPVPLGAGAVVAATSAEADQVVAAGGLASLDAGLLPALGLEVPQVEVPAALHALTVDLSAAGLPSLPLAAPVPASVTVDLRPAIAALAGVRSLPATKLIELRGAMAYASGSCRDGAPVLAGSSQVAGLTVLGRELPTDRATTETVSVLDGGVLDLARLDLGLVELPAVLDTAALRPLVEAALGRVVATLEDLPIPAALARIRVTPGETTREGDRLTQTALRVALEVLGTPVLDLALGRASVGAADVRCSGQAVLGAAAALQCTRRKVTLVDVLPQRGRVLLLGAADRSLAGQAVDIVFDATDRRVARAVVQPDGSFRTTAPMPPRAIRATNAARYQAVVGRERSFNLKLARRMVVDGLRRTGDDVVITGRVVGPMARPVRPVVIQRRVTCSKYAVVGRVKPGRDGRFRAVVPAGDTDQAVFRLGTQVRKTARNPKLFPTFTLPRAVEVS